MLDSDELYKREISRFYPGMFIILLDQSDSMNEVAHTDEDGTTHTKAELVTFYVNKLIQKMIDVVGTDERTGRCKNSLYLSVLGYNDIVSSLLPKRIMSITELEEQDQQDVRVIDRPRHDMGSVGKKKTQHIWILPHHSGRTEMALAFREAQKIVREWLGSEPALISSDAPQRGKQRPRQDCFPPVVIHITDAINTGHDDPATVAKEVQKLATKHGNVLVFNCHFTTETRSQKITFPRTLDPKIADIARAQVLFQMSSVLPELLRSRAERIMHDHITPGSRGFVYNANLDVLVKFLEVGTIGIEGQR